MLAHVIHHRAKQPILNRILDHHLLSSLLAGGMGVVASLKLSNDVKATKFEFQTELKEEIRVTTDKIQSLKIVALEKSRIRLAGND
ncbi:hypothetical protein MMC31_008238, partial [Peltigera leucophlebia]|nr:hypothetical protein [Peltigera leucophlebia]